MARRRVRVYIVGLVWCDGCGTVHRDPITLPEDRRCGHWGRPVYTLGNRDEVAVLAADVEGWRYSEGVQGGDG